MDNATLVNWHREKINFWSDVWFWKSKTSLLGILDNISIKGSLQSKVKNSLFVIVDQFLFLCLIIIQPVNKISIQNSAHERFLEMESHTDSITLSLRNKCIPPSKYFLLTRIMLDKIFTWLIVIIHILLRSRKIHILLWSRKLCGMLLFATILIVRRPPQSFHLWWYFSR